MIDDFHSIAPYSLTKDEKNDLYLNEIKGLTIYHRNHCEKYRNILDAMGYDDGRINEIKNISDVPFMPVRLFKETDMKSIPDDEVFKIMKSSGTTGNPSKIYLDKYNAILQQKVMLRLLGDFIGNKRLPMMIIDTPSVIKDRKMFSARGATIIGLDFAARSKTFVVNDDMSLNVNAITSFLSEYGHDKYLIFGLTYMVWESLYNELERNNLKLDMSNGYLLTGGGWKKLVNEAVTTEQFKQRGTDLCNIQRFMDHYGMTEQSGCIYVECECGHLHTSIYSDFIPRRTDDFTECEIGEKGIIQVMSVLPRSYPGHSILTEDEGMVIGCDDCKCGRKGKYVKIIGRIKNAEIRGCSDAYVNMG